VDLALASITETREGPTEGVAEDDFPGEGREGAWRGRFSVSVSRSSDGGEGGGVLALFYLLHFVLRSCTATPD